MVKKFRLPRKIKKKLQNKVFFYPYNSEYNGYQMASPTYYQVDYDAVKHGIATSLLPNTKKERKNALIEFNNKFKKELEKDYSEAELKVMVDSIFALEYRDECLNMLLKAKEHSEAYEYFIIFVNACLHSCDTTASLCFDSLKTQLKKSNQW